MKLVGGKLNLSRGAKDDVAPAIDRTRHSTAVIPIAAQLRDLVDGHSRSCRRQGRGKLRPGSADMQRLADTVD